jgi:hypothetical protein
MHSANEKEVSSLSQSSYPERKYFRNPKDPIVQETGIVDDFFNSSYEPEDDYSEDSKL